LSESREHRGDNDSLTYKQKFDFDRFGNLYRKAASNPTTGQASPLPFTPIEDEDINKAKNQFATGTTYDEDACEIMRGYPTGFGILKFLTNQGICYDTAKAEI